MSWLRNLFGRTEEKRVVDRDTTLDERLMLRIDELAADASALRSYVDEQLSRLTGEAPPLPAADFFVGAFAERVAFSLNQVDAALDRIDNELPARTGDEDLLRILRAQSTALRSLAVALREIARMQSRQQCEGQSAERP